LYPRELSVELPEYRRQFEVKNVFFADSSALDIFHFDFVHGDAKGTLHQSESVVINEITAQLFFKKNNVVGESLKLARREGIQSLGSHEGVA
jgi:hypothetical protein